MIDRINQYGCFTHMPFEFYDSNGKRILLFAMSDKDSPWNLYYFEEGGFANRLLTLLDNETIECSPTCWHDESGYHLSFIAGKPIGAFRLYRMDGQSLDRMSKPVSMRIARTGFVYQDRIVVGEIQDLVHVHDPNGDYRLEIPGAFIYRVSYRSDDPEILLISGDWIGENGEPFCLQYDLRTDKQAFVECDGLPAYKCSILGESVLFAERISEAFEERRIRSADQTKYIPCILANKVADSVSESMIRQSKRCGCRLDRREQRLLASRPSCLECVEKHIGSAMVLLAEIATGYPFRLRFIGHLYEAEDESQEWTALHDAIRDARKAFQSEGTTPDWEALSTLLQAEVNNAR